MRNIVEDIDINIFRKLKEIKIDDSSIKNNIDEGSNKDAPLQKDKSQ